MSGLFGTAASVVVIALFRQSCPGGPAGCSGPDRGANDWVDSVHGSAVVAYRLVLVATLLTVAVLGLRAATPWPWWLGGLSAGVAVASAVLLVLSRGDDAGLWQRLWVALDQAWLVLVTWRVVLRPPERQKPAPGPTSATSRRPPVE